MLFNRDQMKARAAELAAEGVFLGTSSWKYPGWLGQLYTDDRYIWRGNFSQARFERLCLAEYAEVFKTVCVDAAYYKFPSERYIEALATQVPADFQFGFKVTDEITLKRFPNLPRFGLRAGLPNPNFLNAGLFASGFLQPCERFRQNVGLIIFEFSRFHAEDFSRGRDFVEALDGFLGQLPRGWPYGVEIRNPAFLHPDYFAALRRHDVAHVYNSWSEMPSIEEQMLWPASRTNPSLTGARFLLRPGRKYEEAVKLFSPYNAVKDPYPEGRAAGAKLIQQARQDGGSARTFLFVNNRFEGNALETIAGMLGEAA